MVWWVVGRWMTCIEVEEGVHQLAVYLFSYLLTYLLTCIEVEEGVHQLAVCTKYVSYFIHFYRNNTW